MATDVKLPDSSTALSSMNESQRANWLKTGDLPEESAAPPAKLAPADNGASPTPAKTEVPEPQKKEAKAPAEPAPAKKAVANAETRIKDLLAQIKERDAEIERLRAEPAPKAEKKTENPRPRRNDTDEKGQPKYATDEQFDDAYDKYVRGEVTSQVAKDFETKQREETNRKVMEAQQAKMRLSAKMAEERHPGLKMLELTAVDEKGVPKNAELAKLDSRSVLNTWLVDSEIGADLIFYLTEHPGEIERIQSLGPYAQARELTRLEDTLNKPAAKQEPPPAKEPEPASKAPAPAKTVAGKNTAPPDRENNALQSGDFRSYMDEANEREGVKRR